MTNQPDLLYLLRKARPFVEEASSAAYNAEGMSEEEFDRWVHTDTLLQLIDEAIGSRK